LEVSQVPEQLITIADYIRYSFSSFNKEQVFFGHGTDNSWDEAVSLVLQVLELPWDFDKELWSCRLTTKECQGILEALDKRINKRIPLAYITQKAWFCDYEFYVDERVLIPRSPIAELIQNNFVPWADFELEAPEFILDLCTGSGCIGIACALAYEDADVDLIDISEDAIQVANKNIMAYELQNRVRTIQSDGFKALNQEYKGKYKLIVSNPPYVDKTDFSSMPEEFKSEPELGLVSGDDGLYLVKQILSQAANFLTDDGLLVVEVGNSWVALEDAYPEFPFMWVDFEFGGHGVFVIRADELKQHAW
jgi:ribosomal protein L3 glutamine methyltransferase